MTFPVDAVRARFPSLAAAGGFIFFDNGAAAQVPDRVQQAVADHLLRRNVQRPTSRQPGSKRAPATLVDTVATR